VGLTPRHGLARSVTQVVTVTIFEEVGGVFGRSDWLDGELEVG